MLKNYQLMWRYEKRKKKSDKKVRERRDQNVDVYHISRGYR